MCVAQGVVPMSEVGKARGRSRPGLRTADPQAFDCTSLRRAPLATEWCCRAYVATPALVPSLAARPPPSALRQVTKTLVEEEANQNEVIYLFEGE